MPVWWQAKATERIRKKYRVALLGQRWRCEFISLVVKEEDQEHRVVTIALAHLANIGAAKVKKKKNE